MHFRGKHAGQDVVTLDEEPASQCRLDNAAAREDDDAARADMREGIKLPMVARCVTPLPPNAIMTQEGPSKIGSVGNIAFRKPLNPNGRYSIWGFAAPSPMSPPHATTDEQQSNAVFRPWFDPNG